MIVVFLTKEPSETWIMRLVDGQNILRSPKGSQGALEIWHNFKMKLSSTPITCSP